MAAELGLLSFTPLQTMGNQDSDDSWEVRAFEEDTNNAMGTTWPPRSYTCTFCTREFRSAQALGGHMNVHRRDRARLRQMPSLPSSSFTTSTASVIMNPTYHQELVKNGGVCLIYSLPNPNAVFSPSTVNESVESSTKLLSVPPYSTSNNFMPYNFPPSSINFPVTRSVNSSQGHSSITEHSASAISHNFNDHCYIRTQKDSGEMETEIDLELRLGCGSLPW